MNWSIIKFSYTTTKYSKILQYYIIFKNIILLQNIQIFKYQNPNILKKTIYLTKST